MDLREDPAPGVQARNHDDDTHHLEKGDRGRKERIHRIVLYALLPGAHKSLPHSLKSQGDILIFFKH